MAVAIVNQITELVYKGVPGGTDSLSFPALSIIRVGPSPAQAGYGGGVDYQLNGGVDWSLPGKQPATGSTYYATYTFQADSSFKDFTQLRTELKVNLVALQPDATDMDGSVAVNLFADLPATSLANLYGSIQRVSLIQSLNNITSFQGTELADYGANFSQTLGGPKFAVGFATFSAPNIVSVPTVVPSGSSISTLSTTAQTAISFVTTQPGTIYAGQASVTVPIQAVNAGSSGNVGPGAISIQNTPIVGVSKVSNGNPTAGGLDNQSAADFAAQLKDLFLANDSTTFKGIRRLAKILPNVIDALVVGAGDPLLTRAQGAGGYVDLYIQAEANISATQTDPSVAYTLGVPVVLGVQPVLSITSVVDVTTSTTLSPSNYALVKDVSAVSDSTSSTDSLIITGGITSGDVISVTYNYNIVLQEAQNFFDTQDMNGVPARNFLARSAIEVFVDVADTVVLATGTNPSAALNAAAANVATYIGGLGLGATIPYKTVYDLVDSVDGVSDAQPLSLLAVRGQTTATAIVLARNQYPFPGNITITAAS